MNIKKTLQQLSLNELASIHLDLHGHRQEIADGWIQSSMGILATDLTQSKGRIHTAFYSPLYGSFALLDQIGEIYANTSIAPCPNPAASGIKKALYYFGGMQFDCDEMKALYALRNALVHNGSILTRGLFDNKKNTWKGPFYRFRWNKRLEKPISLPKELWNGDFQNLDSDCDTEINVDLICKLALNCVTHAKELLTANRLEISVKDGEIELYHRFLLHITVD